MDIDNTRALTLSKSFVVSGRSLEVITRDVYLYNHFSFIMQFADCIVGYRMKPLHKRLLVEMAKETKGNKRIMAVGDGFNDIPMMNSADISVQVVTDQTQMVFGDLVVSNLAMIPEIMRQEGQNLSTNVAITVEGTYLNSMIVACCLFFFQFYCAFTATAPVQTGLIYATYGGYSIVGCLFSFFKHFYSAELTKELPALFIESRFLNTMNLKKYLQLVDLLLTLVGQRHPECRADLLPCIVLPKPRVRQRRDESEHKHLGSAPGHEHPLRHTLPSRLHVA